MPETTVIEVRGVGKKFCASFRRAMLYTGLDLARSTVGLVPPHARLRKDEFWALKDVSMELRRGECLGLVGPNGSGKSTLLRILNGIIEPDLGAARVCGQVGALIQVGAGFHPKLTGRENIYISGAIRGMSRREVDARFDQIVDFAELRAFIDMPVQHYSSGMFVRLGYAVAAHIRSDILLMDEVLAVGDAGFRYKCLNHLEQRIAEGCSVVFVTHSLGQLASICSRVVVLSQGRTAFDGDVDGGIGAYQRAISLRRVGNEEGAQVLDPRVTIEGASIELPAGITEVSTDDDVRLRIRLAVHAPVGPLRAEVRLQSVTHGMIASCDSLGAGIPIPGTVGRRDIVLHVPHLPLLPGHFTFRVMVSEAPTGRLFFRHLSAASLHVAARGGAMPGSQHLVALRETWRIEEA